MIVLIKIWPEGDYLPLLIATYMHKITKIVHVDGVVGWCDGAG